MTKIIHLVWFNLVLIGFTPLTAQPLDNLDLKEAYRLFENQYPALKDAGILRDIYDKELELIDLSELPTLNLKAEARLQSESIGLEPEEGMNMPFSIDLPIYSIRAFAEAQYTIEDGGLKDAQRRLKAVDLKTEQQKIEVDRFSLRQRINTLIINVNLIRENAKLLDITLDDLQNRQDQVSAAVENGVTLSSELTKLQVRELEIEAQKDNLQHQVVGLIQSLEQLLGIDLSVDVNFSLPEFPVAAQVPSINRPESQLFSTQRDAISARSDLIDASLKPRINAFAQAGLGYPNPVNILDNNLAPFGIIGVQLQWPITDWKKNQVDREILSLQSMKVVNAEETFEFNMESKEAMYLAELNRLNAQIQYDQEIVELQGEILNQLSAQLEEGVITSTDYITQVNSELKARQNLLVHRTKLLSTQLEFWNDRGAF